jgi:hypothetical protein
MPMPPTDALSRCVDPIMCSPRPDWPRQYHGGRSITVSALRHSTFFFVIFLLRQVKFFQLLRFVRLRPSYVKPGCECICRTLRRFSIDMGRSDGQRPAPTAALSLLSLSPVRTCREHNIAIPCHPAFSPAAASSSVRGGGGYSRLPSAAGERANAQSQSFPGVRAEKEQKAGGEGVCVEEFHHVRDESECVVARQFPLVAIHTAQQTRSSSKPPRRPGRLLA